MLLYRAEDLFKIKNVSLFDILDARRTPKLSPV